MTTITATKPDAVNTGIETKTTADGKIIKVIPATKSFHPERDNVTPTRKKLRVAAYCRVSTSQEEQQGSFKLQKEYYEKLINKRPDWELVKIYGDEGKSGTKLRGRKEFLEMLDDARAGMIDLIITKATSRFGRNTAEFMQVLDELESYGVEVSFESEGIMSSGQETRMILQILGATNEHYSSALSNNVRWANERNMREGKATICYKRFLGYEKGDDGQPKIVEDEARIVRLIFSMFIKGDSYASIARYLNEQHFPTATKNGKWTGIGVKRILINEKYTGDVLLQKTFKRSYLDKARINRGEKPQVLIENNHEAIIDRVTFAKAKEMVERRSKRQDFGTDRSPFVGKIICAECGNFYGHRTWNSRGNIKYSMWVCKHKYSEENTYGGDKCKSANLRQDWIEQGYLYTMNQLLAARSEYLAKYERKLGKINRQLESGKIEDEIKAINKKLRTIDAMSESLKQEQEIVFGRNDEYAIRQASLKSEMQSAIARKAELNSKLEELRVKQRDLMRFIDTFKTLPRRVTKYSRLMDNTFTFTIEYISVKRNTVTYYLYGNECAKFSVDELKRYC